MISFLLNSKEVFQVALTVVVSHNYCMALFKSVVGISFLLNIKSFPFVLVLAAPLFGSDMLLHIVDF